jgi:hypothetical protein
MNPPTRSERPQSTEISHSPDKEIGAEGLRGHSLAVLAGLVLLVVGRAVFWAEGGDPVPLLAQILDQDTTEQHVYDGAKTIIEYSHAELLSAFPELRRLQTAESQKELPAILGKVGANVEALVDGLPDLISQEDVTQQTTRVERAGSVQTRRLEPFSYMILAHESSKNVDLEEYRTDSQGKRTKPQQLERDFCLTRGFATMWTLFHPGNRSAANFRLLGQEELDGHKTDLVAFAQRPGWATVVGRVVANGRSVLILYQGIAWIDVPTYQIIRMRTDLLAPRWDVGLRRQTTEVEFSEVHLPGVATPLWLPQTVAVTTSLTAETLRNEHRYTNYRLFRVASTIKPVEPGETVPKN